MTFSLPEKDKKNIAKRAKKAGLTISTYLLHAVRVEQELMDEDELVRLARQAKREYRAGKAKKLRSLKDLMD